MIRLLADHGWTNVFIERLWRSLKYEDVHLKGYADGREARTGISAWISFYNGKRPHQALGHRTPMAVWRAGVMGSLAATQSTCRCAWTTLAPRPHAHRSTRATAFRGVKGKDNGAVASNQDRCSCGPTDRVHLKAQLQPPTPGRPASAAEPTPRETVVRNAG